MIVAWNSLMISGLTRAYMVFTQEPKNERNCEIYRQLAVNAMTFILQNQWQNHENNLRLHRVN